MSVLLQQEFAAKLLAAYERQPGKLKAIRLWNAAAEVMPEWFKDTMDQAKNELKDSRRVGAEHIDLLDRMLNREGDFVTARMLKDELTKFPRAKGLIDNQAEVEDRSYELVHFEWNAAGNAFHDLAWELLRVLPLNRRRTSPKPLLGPCALCWRTAPRSDKDSFHCTKHLPRPNNSAYKEAHGLSRWRSPTQEANSAAFYVYVRMREVRRVAPSGLETAEDDDNTDHLLQQVYLGQYVPLDKFIDQPRKLDWYWPRLPYSKEFLSRSHGSPDLTNAASVIAALDPLGRHHRRLHQHLHTVMERDQRLLIEMLIATEAWLSAAAMRRKYHGGRRIAGKKLRPG